MKKLTEFFIRHKHHIATVAFFVGFFVDIITFRTINLDVSQIILAGYLVIVAGSILVLASPVHAGTSKIDQSMRAWLPIIHQYVAGNLLSAFLVLYFSSGSLSQSWPFLIIVALAAFGNETFFVEKYRLPFQTTLFFLNLVLFFALATPIALGSLGFLTFLSSVGISVGFFILFFLIGRFLAPSAFSENTSRIVGGVLTVGIVVVLLYVTHLIPPIPLSAKSIDVYHSVTKVGDVYLATDENRSWYERFLDLQGITLHLTSGESAYVFSSIFAPAHFGADVVHQWEHFEPESGRWIVQNTVRFPILGGRPEGYRGYSFIESPMSGRWRISVKTPDGAVIGRIHLIVEQTQTHLVTVEKVLK